MFIHTYIYTYLNKANVFHMDRARISDPACQIICATQRCQNLSRLSQYLGSPF